MVTRWKFCGNSVVFSLFPKGGKIIINFNPQGFNLIQDFLIEKKVLLIDEPNSLTNSKMAFRLKERTTSIINKTQ